MFAGITPQEVDAVCAAIADSGELALLGADAAGRAEVG